MSIQEKTPACTLSNSIDLSHHLSELAKSREVSPLKRLQKYFIRPGMINIAGGMPDPAYFPFASISGDALLPDAFPSAKPSEASIFSWFWNLFGVPTEKSERFTVPKYAAKKGDVDLASALQYGPATGVPALQNFVREFTAKVYQPGYADWTTLISLGNTDGYHRVLSTLCNPGERILVEEWCYPSVLADAKPMGLLPTPVKIDAQGMSAVDLERVLATWDEKAQNAPRPHVIYTVPIGQNPTGSTMGSERKKAIYDICVKYDVIILEDDPYFFLQEGPYQPKELRAKAKTAPQLKKGEDTNERFINSLVPSFVRFDYQGRVIRLDTFSKIIAPGSRLGWFTCNPVFAERLERQGESSTQAASGFSQSLLAQLLTRHWSFSDVIRWLQGLQTQYTLRRDFFVDCVLEAFDVRPASGEVAARAVEALSGGPPGVMPLTAYAKTTARRGEKQGEGGKVPLFSFVPPSSGMFVWLIFHVQDHLPPPTDPNVPKDQTLDERIWTDIADHGLLITPGIEFAAIRPDPSQDVTFRLSFSRDTHENMREAVKILAHVLNKYVA